MKKSICKAGDTIKKVMPVATKRVNGNMGNFVAIDFETANYKRTSACAIGLVVVENRKVVETFSTLIKPEPFWFLPDFTEIHGITAKDVEDKGNFEDVWPEIKKRIKGQRLLAHNAPFDRSVLNACLQLYNIKFPQPEFVCTCRIAKAALPKSPNHKLDTICSELKIKLNHHEAESDALGCAKIALELCDDKTISLSHGLLNPTDW